MNHNLRQTLVSAVVCIGEMYFPFPEDIQVHFFEEQDGNIVWEGFGDFQPTHVHKQVAISFRTPRYKSLEVDAPVKVHIQLRRPSDGATSEPLPFEYLPLNSGRPAFWSLRKALGKKGNYSMFSSILASNTALLTGGPIRNGVDVPSPSWIRMVRPHQAGAELPTVPDGAELTKVVEPKNVISSNLDGTSTGITVPELARKSAVIEKEKSEAESNNNDVIMVDGTDKKDTISGGYNYAAVNKWNAMDSGEVDANANIQNEVGRKDDGVTCNDNEDVISQEETCRSLNELLSQVAELDEIYADTRARLLNQGITEAVSPDSVSPNLEDSQSPRVIEMDVEDVYDDDNQTYSSLQLAMKNPIELLDIAPGRYEDIIHQGLSSQNNKRDVSSTSLIPESPDTKLPPLPPKRIRRSPPTPPARPDHPIFPHEPSSTLAPDKILPPTPDGTNAKQLKPSLFQKLFSKKSKSSNKKDGTLTPRAVSVSREESVGNVSAAMSIRRGSEPVSEFGTPQPELTEAEHYALYTDMAPHATVSEFDEMSFYYSPVEGGSIITAGENIVNRRRDIFT
jgi:Rel/ankyrin family protein